jgi:FSR family fosmidomycin resistance protein-like MFS transporter
MSRYCAILAARAGIDERQGVETGVDSTRSPASHPGSGASSAASCRGWCTGRAPRQASRRPPAAIAIRDDGAAQSHLDAVSAWLDAVAVDRRRLRILGAGHLAVDACQGALPGMLPFLIAERGLSYGKASGLILAMTVASSVIQPLFGGFSDRRRIPCLLPIGLVMAGTGISLVGVLSAYPLVFAAVLLSGVGVAAYHPEAASSARDAAGQRPGTAMSLFAVGGNLGMALGPALVTVLILALGLHGTLLLAAPLLVVATVVASDQRRFGERRAARAVTEARGRGEPPSETRAPPPNRWGAFARLSVAISCRSLVYYALVTFVPLYLVAELHTGKAFATGALTAMLVAGAMGTLIGGRLADRVGPRRVFATSTAFLPPVIGGLLLAGPGVAVAMFVLAGAATITTFSVTVVMGQQMLPRRTGLASGVTLGLSIGAGGVAAWPLGLVADAHGLRAVLLVVGATAVLTPVLALTLPAGRPRRPCGPAPPAGAHGQASAEAR